MPIRVLISPLHWGLGHATRCIPLIQEQLEQDNHVIVSASGGPLKILKSKFPDLEFLDIPFMEITYPKDGNMSRHFFFKGPKLLVSIWREHRILQQLIVEKNIDLVISDSRFGLWSKKARSIFVTHQVQILSPHFQGFINRLNRWVMDRYDEVWIPDYEEAPGLAGDLSHPTKMPKSYKYIGPLSRFKKEPKSSAMNLNILGIVSGPEPQRTLFEAELARRCIEMDQESLIIRGKPTDEHHQDLGKLKLSPHLEDDEFQDALLRAKHIIARSGYSTIMDFHVMGLKAEWHPTPGQTEQEYLAKLHS